MYFGIGPSIYIYVHIIYYGDNDDVDSLKVLTIRNNYFVLGTVLEITFPVRGR